MLTNGRVLPPPRRGELLVLAGILVVALLLRLPALEHPVFGVDEQLTAEESLRLAERYDWAWWRIDTVRLSPLSGATPVAYYLAALAMQLTAPDFTMLRLPFLLVALVTVMLTWRMARRLTGSPAAALTAATFLALSAAHAEYSTLARFYMPAMLLVLVWAELLLVLLRRASLPAAAALTAVTAIGCLTYVLFPLFPFAGVAYAFRMARRSASEDERVRLRRACGLVVATVAVGAQPAWMNLAELVHDAKNTTLPYGAQEMLTSQIGSSGAACFAWRSRWPRSRSSGRGGSCAAATTPARSRS